MDYLPTSSGAKLPPQNQHEPSCLVAVTPDTEKSNSFWNKLNLFIYTYIYINVHIYFETVGLIKQSAFREFIVFVILTVGNAATKSISRILN